MAEHRNANRMARVPNVPALEKTMHPLTLRFADAALERHYHDARLRYRFVAGRFSSLAGAVAWGTFLLLSISIDHDPVPLIRLTTIGGLIGMLAMFGLHFVLKPGRWVEISGVLVLLVNFCVLLFLTAFTNEANAPHFSPVTVFTLTSVMSFSLVGVTFWEGARIAVVSIAFYYIAVVFLQPEPFVAMLYQSAWMRSM